MPFNVAKFQKTKFVPVIEEVSVPDLQEFFDEGEKAVWKVRGLTGQEMGRANEIAERNKNISAIVDGLVAGGQKEKTDAIKNMLGLDQLNVPDDIAKRIAYLQYGSVDPVCTEDMAVKLCTVKGIEFYLLTNTIIKLTGVGQTVGKQKPCGETQEFGQVLRSDTEIKDSSLK
jgi:hypothetical protein